MYGPVCPVVWEGEGREAFPYPDFVGAYDFGKEILRKKIGDVEYTWNGQTSYAAFCAYPALDWVVVISAVKAEVMQSVRFMGNLFGILVAIMASFSLIMGVVFSMRLVSPISHAVSGLTNIADHVAAASMQVSSASKHMAEGAGEQASSLEETSSSLEEMSSMTKQNADHAEQARTMTEEIGRIVAKVSRHMEDMGKAIAEITTSSEETGKINQDD